MTLINKLKILHLARDEKFVDMAIQAFAKFKPAINDLCLYAQNCPRHVKTTPVLMHSKWAAIRGLRPDFLGYYDLIIIHSLHPAFFRTLLNVPASVTLIWVGWGYDYYDLIYSNEDELLLPETRKAKLDNSRKTTLGSKVRRWLELWMMPRKAKVISRLDFFSPVLPNEYSQVANQFESKRFPKFARWNYGSLEDDLAKGLESNWVYGDSILLGNSASSTNNHREALTLLASLSTSQKVVVPLSYGSVIYKDDIVRIGTEMLGSRFSPMLKFIPLDQYNQLLLSCGFVIMNHVRQQALGNIVTMLYLGARIFLREECDTYRFFKSEGAIIDPIQLLSECSSLIQKPLTKAERQNNRGVAVRLWSRAASEQKTKNLINAVIALKTKVNSYEVL